MNLSGEGFVINEGERVCPIILAKKENAGWIILETRFIVERKVVNLDAKEKSNYGLY